MYIFLATYLLFLHLYPTPASAISEKKFYLESKNTFLTDTEVQNFLSQQGLRIEQLWEKLFLSPLRTEEEMCILEASEKGDINLISAELSEKIQSNLNQISKRISALSHVDLSFLAAVSRYFSPESWFSRLKEKDEFILDRPSIPLKQHIEATIGTEFRTYLSFDKLSQSSHEFKKIEGRYCESTEYNSPSRSSWPTFICYYLYFSGIVLGLPFIKSHFSLSPKIVRRSLQKMHHSQTDYEEEICGEIKSRAVGHTKLKPDLKEFDHRSLSFAGDEDQGNHGSCWIFAAKRLVEEQICRKQPELCPLRLSAYDLWQDHWSLLSFFEGGYMADALWTATRNGVCSYDKAPYLSGDEEDLLHKALSTFASYLRTHPDQCPHRPAWDRLMLPSGHQMTLDPQLLAQIDHYRQFFLALEDNLTAAASQNASLAIYLEDFSQPMLGTSLLETRSILASLFGQDADLALFYTLVGEDCRSHRIIAPLKGLLPVDLTFDFTTATAEKIIQISEFQQETGNSLALGLCVETYLANTLDFDEDDKCGAHAIVMNALRFNTSLQQWEGHFRNSWGNSTILNGWLPVDHVFPFVFMATTFRST